MSNNNTKIEETKDNTKEEKENRKTKPKKEEDKDIYFIIVYKRNQKENPNDFIFSEENNVVPEKILDKEILTSNNKFIYKKVFKINLFNKRKSKNERIVFFIEEKDKYSIFLETKENSFIYNVELKKGIKYLDNILGENVDQNLLNQEEKLDLFLQALKKNFEEYKIEYLYKETINLFIKKRFKSFSLLITLFINISEKKNLCRFLIENFYEKI